MSGDDRSQNSNPDEDKKPKKNIIYFGEDFSYFSELQKRFYKSFPEYGYNFKLISLLDPKSPHQFFIELLKQKKPHVLYVDFSVNTNDMFYIGWLIIHESRFKDTAVIAIVDNQLSPQIRETILLLGFRFLHVKSSEIHDAVFDAMYVHDRSKVKDPNFCTAKMTDDVKISQVVRLQTISEKAIRIEGDIALAPGDEMEVKTTLYDKIVPSLRYIAKDIRTTNLSFDYHARVSFSYTFVDQPVFDPNIHSVIGKGGPVEMDENLDEAEKQKILQDHQKRLDTEKMQWQQQANEDREIKIQQAQKKLKAWIKNEYDSGDSRKLRLLFVDKEYTVYKMTQKRLDYQEYEMRAKTLIHDFEMDIMIYSPEFIFFQYESEQDAIPSENGNGNGGTGTVGTTTAPSTSPAPVTKKKEEVVENPALTKNGETSLRTVMACLQKMKDYKPFIIIFNCKIASAALQKEFNYPQIMVYPSPLNYDVCINMASVFQKKKEKKEAEQKRSAKMSGAKSLASKNASGGAGEEEVKIYFKQNDYLRSSARMIYPAKIMSASESVVMIDCKKFLPEYTVHELSIGDVKMYVTVVPNNVVKEEKAGAGKKDSGSKNTYKALIHNIGEEEKKALRRFVNSVFFRKVEEEKAKELDAFKKLNEQKDKEKRAKALAEKKAKEMEEGISSSEEAKKSVPPKDHATKEEAKPQAAPTPNPGPESKSTAETKDKKKAA